MKIDIKNKIDNLTGVKLPALDARLASALEFVREGGVVADIGTDHAYLPIYLVGSGISARAIASDINAGPIERAREHISSASLEGKIDTLHAGGLLALESYAPDDIIIFGMGGELIASMIAEAEWVRDPNIRLIMQPMTHAELLRAFLLENGFCIMAERLTRSGKIYQTVVASFDGVRREVDLATIYGGSESLRSSELYPEFIDFQLGVERKAAEAMRGAGRDCSQIDSIIAALESCRKERE